MLKFVETGLLPYLKNATMEIPHLLMDVQIYVKSNQAINVLGLQTLNVVLSVVMVS